MRAVPVTAMALCMVTTGACYSWDRPSSNGASDGASDAPVDQQIHIDGKPNNDSAPRSECPSNPNDYHWIQVGTAVFVMGSGEFLDEGSPASRESCGRTNERAHEVELTRAFELAQTEVTRAQYEAIVGPIPDPDSNACADPACPVSVTWHRAAHFCNQLSAQSGIEHCYKCATDGSDCQQVENFVGAHIYRCKGYRLPTEAEWELAYRVETQPSWDLYIGTITNCDGKCPRADQIGWHGDLTEERPVCGKLPNALGLYDMAGNRREWCNDVYRADLGSERAVDPWGAEPTAAVERVARGGAYWSAARDLRGAAREGLDPKNKVAGIRCARTLQ